MNLRLSVFVSSRLRPIFLATLTLLCLALSCEQIGYGQAPTGLPARINEEESVAHYQAIWTLNGDHYDGSWSEGGTATAILTVTSFTPQSVVIHRTDTAQSVSAGLTATYTGHISADGNSILDGKVKWIWPGHRGYPGKGSWTAHWEAQPVACGADSLLPPLPGAGPLCGDKTLPFNYSKNNFHSYEDMTEVCTSKQSAGCTVDYVFQILIRTPEAIAPVTSSVNEHDIASCAILPLKSCPGASNRIRIVLDQASHTVTNYTLPGHLFYPGQVTRQIIDWNGTVVIKTVGMGVGCDKALNVVGGTCKIWPDCDDALRVAVWANLNLGQPPPVGQNDSCKLGMKFVMWLCDTL